MKTYTRKANHTVSKYLIASIAALLVLIVIYIISQTYPLRGKAEIKINNNLLVPKPSYASGFYTEKFFLELRSPYKNAKIYYTLDGTVPNEGSEIFTHPILIDDKSGEPNILSEIKNSPVFKSPLNMVFKGTVLRAVLILNDSIKSKEVVSTFFVHPKGRNRYKLPVVSIITDRDNFFGYKNGIYVNGATTDDKDYYLKNKIDISNNKSGFPANYKRRGPNWIRPVHLEFFEQNSNRGFEIDAGIAIHGNATRERPQKSLKVLLNAKIGDSIVNYPLFNGSERVFHTFLLRNSGQDMYRARLRDALTPALLKNRVNIDYQLYRPCIVFLNGEYWGIYDIRERVDEYFFSIKYNIPVDSLTLLGPYRKVEHGEEEARNDYLNLEKFIATNDLSIQANYSKVSNELDIANFIDYIICEVFVSNRDWPHNNVLRWRYNFNGRASGKHFPKDGRWRFVIYDTDYAYGAEYEPSFPFIDVALKAPETSKILNGLLKNDDFKELFFKRFNYHLQTTFKIERTVAVINSLQAEIQPEMQEHIERWRTVNSIKEWESEVEVLRDFARKRPGYQQKELETLYQKLKN